MSSDTEDRPLVVDLDGTLIRGDMLFESAFQTLARNPLNIFSLISALLKGKSQLKDLLTKDFNFNPATLPYVEEVIRSIQSAKSNGRTIVLASASNQAIVDKIAEHLQFFDVVLGSTSTLNLSGRNKAQALNDQYGVGNYDYVGNSSADIEIWKQSSGALIVSSSTTLINKARKVNENVKVITDQKTSGIRTWVKQLRIHQWVKNVLLFIPVITAFKLSGPLVLMHLALAFLAFSLVASSVYIINDAVDMENDRQHPTKRNRPMAAGIISLPMGVAVSVLSLLAGLTLGFLVGLPFLSVLLTYLGITFAYSFWLKRTALVDCIVLAGLYTLRIMAGGVAADIQLSFWLISFSVFFFLSLAWVKRYAELEVAAKSGKPSAVGRGYSVQDLPLILAFGSASGFLAVLIFALYLDSEAIRIQYAYPPAGWIAIPVLLYVVGRLWLKAHRGEMNEDPIIFVLKDKASVVSGVLIAAALFIGHIGLGPWI